LRPLKLRLQGFSSFRERTEVDFSALSLFAITGPQGAGKTSIMDALTYALFGRIPRLGDDVKKFINRNHERMEVSLEFSSNGRRYRIHRYTGRAKAGGIQLERFDPTSSDVPWPLEADRMGEANRRIEEIIGMDYEGFTRSVLLPQGQFQLFLAGGPAERSKVLDDLLRLDVYKVMQEEANKQAKQKLLEAEGITQRLSTELADATPQNLSEKRLLLAKLKAEAALLEAQLRALQEAERWGQALSSAQRKLNAASSQLQNAEEKLQAARSILADGESLLVERETRLRDVDGAIEANPYDADVYIRLERAREAARNVAETEARLGKLEEYSSSKAEEHAEAGASVAAALKAEQEVALDYQLAFDALEELRQRHRVAQLLQGLARGDPCPVCGEAMATLPQVEHRPLREGEEACGKAEEKKKAIERKRQDGEKRLASLERDVANTQSRVKEEQEQLARRRETLSEASQGQAMATDEIEVALATQRRAREEREGLDRQRANLQQELQKKAGELAAAGTNASRYQDEVDRCRGEIDAAEKEAGAAANAVRSTAEQEKWSEIASAGAKASDVISAVQHRQDEVGGARAEAQRQIGSIESDSKRLERDIELAAGLREQEKEARETAGVANKLASFLRADHFQAFIREQALQVLAEDGSNHLNKLSQGRYDLEASGQDFEVVDHWNGDEQRAVKTLSGGETFVASLALALALAERLPSLGAAGTSTSSLESLFIDEGFGALDSDNLEAVTSALEEIGSGGSRMVGIITHLLALAERMPACIRVEKSQSGSTLTVE